MATYSFKRYSLIVLFYHIVLNMMIESSNNSVTEIDKSPIQGRNRLSAMQDNLFSGVPYAAGPICNLSYKWANPVQSKRFTVWEWVNF